MKPGSRLELEEARAIEIIRLTCEQNGVSVRLAFGAPDFDQEVRADVSYSYKTDKRRAITVSILSLLSGYGAATCGLAIGNGEPAGAALSALLAGALLLLAFRKRSKRIGAEELKAKIDAALLSGGFRPVRTPTSLCVIMPSMEDDEDDE